MATDREPRDISKLFDEVMTFEYTEEEVVTDQAGIHTTCKIKCDVNTLNSSVRQRKMTFVGVHLSKADIPAFIRYMEDDRTAYPQYYKDRI